MGATTAPREYDEVIKNLNIPKYVRFIHYVMKHLACGTYVELLTTADVCWTVHHCDN